MKENFSFEHTSSDKKIVIKNVNISYPIILHNPVVEPELK
jgi:hypothetical protein